MFSHSGKNLKSPLSFAMSSIKDSKSDSVVRILHVQVGFLTVFSLKDRFLGPVPTMATARSPHPSREKYRVRVRHTARRAVASPEQVATCHLHATRLMRRSATPFVTTPKMPLSSRYLRSSRRYLTRFPSSFEFVCHANRSHCSIAITYS